jgi:hypothetical protein
MNQSKKDLFTERAAKALEGIEMLLAMWIEKSVPAGELWVGEGPDLELSRKAWRSSETTPSRPFEKALEPSGIDHRIQHIEERLNHLASDLAALEARVHEEQPE